ncbi:MAG: hypothetical protein JST26_11220 [Bacteroidetes bacterium]|nr:hypothetical protein [Bacteroidota bacterium]
MMTKDQIANIIDPQFPMVYAPTTEPTKLIFEDGTEMVGYFQHTKNSDELEKQNKFTFVEFGEKAQKFRATQDDSFVTTIDANLLKNVEYPSYSGILKERLKKIEEILNEAPKRNWPEYKNKWVEDVKNIINTVMYKWLNDYEREGFLKFSLLTAKRFETNLGEYLIPVLEISFKNGSTVVLDPIAGVTSDYNGRIDFYLMGNVYKKVSILRKIMETGETVWIYAKNYDTRTHFPLGEQLFIKQINEWLQ